MPKFKVIAGKHICYIGERKVLYPMGAVFESRQELDKIFRNKFVRMEESTPTTHEQDESMQRLPHPSEVPPRVVPPLAPATAAPATPRPNPDAPAGDDNILDAKW